MAEKIDRELMKVTTSEFRVSYPHLFKPSQMVQNGKPVGDPAYSIEMIFDKESTDMKPLQKALHMACVAKWGKDKTKWPTPIKNPIRDGDKPAGKKREVRPEHEGCWVVKASTKAEYGQPHVVDGQRQAILNAADFYAGCYARAAIMATAYDMGEGSTGVKFVLDGVQKIRNGKALSGKQPADQLFGAIESDDIDEDFASGEAENEEQESFM